MTIWNHKNSTGKLLLDIMGKKVEARSFDDQTCEAEVFVYNRRGVANATMNEDDGRVEIALAKVRLLGAKMIDRRKKKSEDRHEGKPGQSQDAEEPKGLPYVAGSDKA